MTASQATEQAADVKLDDLSAAVVAASSAQDANKGNGETKDEQSEPTSTNQQQTHADEVPQPTPDSAAPTAAPTTSEAVEEMLAPAISLGPPAATQHPEPTPLPQRKPSNVLSQAKRRFSVALLPKPTISGHVDGEMHVSAASTSMTAAVDGVNNAETNDNKLETVVTPSASPSGLPMHHRKPTSFATNLRHRLSQSFVLATHRPSREPRSQELDMPSDTPAPPPRVSTATESAMQSQPQNATTGTASQLASVTQPQQRLSHPAMGEKVDTIFSQVKKRIASATEAAAAVPLSARRMSRHGRVSSDMGAAISTEAGAMTPAQRLKQQQQQQQQQQQEMTAEHTPHSLHRQLADTDEKQQPQQQQPMLKTLGHVLQPASPGKAKPATAPEITATSSAGPATTSSHGRNMTNAERTSTTLPASKRRRQSIQVVRSLLSEQLSPASPPRRSTTMAPAGPRPGAGVAVNAPAASTPASVEQAAAKHVDVSKGSHLGFSSSAGAGATRGDASDTALPSAISAATAVAPAPRPRTSSFSSPTATSFSPTTLRDTITEKLKSFLGRVRSARDEARRSERFAGSTGIAGTRRGPQAANGHADSAPAAAAVEVAKEGSPAKIDPANKTAEHQDQRKPGNAGPATIDKAVAEGKAEAHEAQVGGKLPGDVSEGHPQQPPHDPAAKDITHGTVATSGHQSQTAPTATTMTTPPPPLPSSSYGHGQPGSDSIPASGAPSSDEDAATSDRATGGHGNVYGPRSSADVPRVPALPASAVEQNTEKGKDEGEKDDKSKGAAAGWDEEVQEENK